MKLTRIALAKLIGFIERNHALNMTENQIECIDDIIDIEVPQPEVVRPSNDAIESLMAQMAAGTNKIDAIRSYRAITSMGLKESKDAVERYWKAEKPNSYTYTELKSKLTNDYVDIFSPDEMSAVMRFLDKL